MFDDPKVRWSKMPFCNNTKKEVYIHPYTIYHGCKLQDNNQTTIQPLETRIFLYPSDATPYIKIEEYCDGLMILVSPVVYKGEKIEESVSEY